MGRAKKAGERGKKGGTLSVVGGGRKKWASEENQRGPMSPRLFLGAMTSSFNVFVRVLVAMDGSEYEWHISIAVKSKSYCK